MDLANFDFKLPTELIAQNPLPERSSSRLLYLNKKTGAIAHHYFKDLPNLITSKDLLVFNDTKVIPARLLTTKPTGGKVEILIERVLANNNLLAQSKNKKLKIGTKLILTADTWFEITGHQDGFFQLVLHSSCSPTTILNKFGHTPLPPYIKHQPTTMDKKRYQTIYAKHSGAVAAPTAGLHFDAKLMQQLHRKNISTAFLTLHVGAGTFQPLRTQNITEHKMHKEYIDVAKTVCNQVLYSRA